MRVDFVPSSGPTLGVEWELALVDADSLELVPRAQRLLDAVDDPKRGPIRQEYLTNMIELVTGVHHRVDEAMDDLRESLQRVRAIAGDDTLLLGAGVHPRSPAHDQHHFDTPRYHVVAERNAYWGRLMSIFGTHVHVGIDHRDKALPITYGLARFSPYFIALTASSPYWEGEDTGYASHRTMLFQQMPTNGLPYPLDSWDEFEHYASELEEAGMITVPSEIRWDVRPSTFGTVENRVLDSVPTFAELGAMAALAQCLATYMSRELDDGRGIARLPMWFMKENKWRAARYGMDAILVVDADNREELVTDHVRSELARLAPIAERLDCVDELAGVAEILERGAAYQRQLAVAARPGATGRDIVRHLVRETSENVLLGPED